MIPHIEPYLVHSVNVIEMTTERAVYNSSKKDVAGK